MPAALFLRFLPMIPVPKDPAKELPIQSIRALVALVLPALLRKATLCGTANPQLKIRPFMFIIVIVMNLPPERILS